MRRRLLVLGLLTAGVVLAVVGLLSLGSPSDPPPTTATTARPDAPAAAPAPAPEDRGLLAVDGEVAPAPTRLRIPSLSVTASLDRVGVVADGSLETPRRWQVPAWYADGPRPGEIGPAVIAGHVDSPTGPAVFADLARLAPGDMIEVDGGDRSTQRFRVDRLLSVPKGRFPTRAVYGQTPDAQLRLITCDGPYEADGYRDNLVVFATRVPA